MPNTDNNQVEEQNMNDQADNNTITDQTEELTQKVEALEAEAVALATGFSDGSVDTADIKAVVAHSEKVNTANTAVEKAKKELEAHKANLATQRADAKGEQVIEVLRGLYGDDLPNTLYINFKAEEPKVVLNREVKKTTRASSTRSSSNGSSPRKRVQWNKKDVTDGTETLPVKAAIERYITDPDQKATVQQFYIRAIPALKEVTAASGASSETNSPRSPHSLNPNQPHQSDAGGALP